MTIFQLVTIDADNRLVSQIFETDDPAAAFEVRGFAIENRQASQRLRPELRNQPCFTGLCGPCWGGISQNGQPIIRYEDWKAYERLSA